MRVLIKACATDATTVLAALDAAVRFGLLDGAELGRGRIAFPHTLTRQAVLDLIDPSRLAGLHARVGEVLQASGSGSPAVIRQLAHHFARAAALGYGDTAAGYLRLAAREAERSLAFEDAAAWYTQAADLAGGSDPNREELWFDAADAYVRAGEFASARTQYLRLTDSRDPRVRLRAAIGYENAAWRPGLPGTQARALLAHALEGVPDIITRGFVMEDSQALLAEGARFLAEVVEQASIEERTDQGLIKEKLRVELRRFFRKRSGRRPFVLPVIMEI